MGNLGGKGLSVKYKATRGTHEPGDNITDPKDWVEEMLKADRDATMERFNALTPDQQQAFEDCFGDGDMEVFKNVGNYEGWCGDATDEDYVEVYERLIKVLHNIPAQ